MAFNITKTCTMGDCAKKMVARGMCSMHYARATKSGEITPGITDPVKRFWSKVDKSGDCWEWTGGTDRGGYGNFYEGPSNRAALAHRHALKLSGVDIPNGAYVDHICWNRTCVNPEHLRFVTKKQNSENRSGPRSDNTSGYLGVALNKRTGRFLATVVHNGKRYSGGAHASAELANDSAIALRKELYTHNLRDRV